MINRSASKVKGRWWERSEERARINARVESTVSRIAHYVNGERHVYKNKGEPPKTETTDHRNISYLVNLWRVFCNVNFREIWDGNTETLASTPANSPFSFLLHHPMKSWCNKIRYYFIRTEIHFFQTYCIENCNNYRHYSRFHIFIYDSLFILT